jgi:outer membrane protein assembly factor BamB
MRSVMLALAFAVGSAWAADGPDSANVRGESTTTRKRLAEAEQKILAGQTADAVDELQRIADDSGDDLVTADGKQFTSARQYIHRFLAKLPDAALTRYRDRVEEPAARLLANGRERRDPERLQQLLDRYAVSRPAEDAILMLAELAFERGEFGSAERHWRTLLPDSEPKYPSPRSKPADIEAKIIASTIFRGDRIAAGGLLEEFAKRHPDAAGRVAGRTGPYLASLVALANERTAGRPTEVAGGWTSLGGSAARDGRVGGSLPRHWPARPTWTVPIPAAIAGWRGQAGRPPSVGAVKALAFHPVVIDRTAYVADAGRVFAIELRTGAIRLIFDATRIDRPRLPAAALGVPSPVDADFTLSAADGRLYFRFGDAAIFPTAEEGEPAIDRPSLLVALAPPSGAEPAAIVWRRFPPVPDGVPASWEGAPLVLDGAVYAAFVRSDGGRVIHAIACYRGEAERPEWVADLCETASAEPRTRHELLTRAGRNIVFCSHSGIVAAVNAQTGKPAWAYRYPRIRRYAADGRHRDLSPPVSADGRVFVAPNDGDQLFAFDSETGSLLWSDGPIRVDHLLGAANGKVVATIAGPQRGLRAYDAATGSCDFPRGWRNHDDPFLATFGRGLLSDEYILWPTASALYTIRLVDGTVAAQPARGPHGNLAFANGTLLVAAPNEIRGNVIDPEPVESTSPPPVLLGKAEPLPAGKPADAPPLEPLPPALGSPAKLERVSAKSPTPAVNLGTPHVVDGVVRLIRRAGTVVECVDANGGSIRLPMDDASGAIWLEKRVLLFHDTKLSLFDPLSGQRLWSREFADLRTVVPLPAGVLVQSGGHTLVALHRASGATAWVLNAKNERRELAFAIESMPAFVGLACIGDRVLAQRSNGTRWIVDARDGRRIDESPTLDRAWIGPPAALDGDAIALVDGANRITRIRPDGRVEWSRAIGREASLTGEPAEVRRMENWLFTVVRRNHGSEIDCRSPDDGVAWTSPPLVAGTAFDRESLALDRRHLLVATRELLVAFRRDTGRIAWSRPLDPPARWRVAVVRDRLLVHAAEAVAREPVDPLVSFARFPHPRRLVGLAGTAWDGALDRIAPIRLVDPLTGDLQQRLDAPAAGAVAVLAAPDGVTLAAGGALHRFTR